MIHAHVVLVKSLSSAVEEIKRICIIIYLSCVRIDGRVEWIQGGLLWFGILLQIQAVI